VLFLFLDGSISKNGLPLVSRQGIAKNGRNIRILLIEADARQDNREYLVKNNYMFLFFRKLGDTVFQWPFVWLYWLAHSYLWSYPLMLEVLLMKNINFYILKLSRGGLNLEEYLMLIQPGVKFPILSTF